MGDGPMTNEQIAARLAKDTEKHGEGALFGITWLRNDELAALLAAAPPAPRAEGAADEVREQAREAAISARLKGGSGTAAVDAAAEVAWSAGLAAGEARATARERAAVVAWMRGKAEHWRSAADHPDQHPRNAEDCSLFASQYAFDADRIERAEHLGVPGSTEEAGRG